MSGAALRLEGVNKSFDGNQALAQASLEVGWGEVHALLGENGAGKSTLMNIVCGLYTADDGRIQVGGNAAQVNGPADATRYGIGMVHQHFKLVGPFSVAENVLLACSDKLGISAADDEIAERITDAAGQLGFEIDPFARTDALSVAERQRVEIIKLILLGADILVLDEPTAVLTDDESEAVLSLLQGMAEQGKAIILITHRLREVTRFADRVTIMRGGQTVVEGADAGSMDKSDLARAMVGDTLQDEAASSLPARAAGTRLALKNVNVRRADGSRAIKEFNLDVRAGEILGIAGVGGNGQTELTEAIYGLLPLDKGQILIDDHDLTTRSVKQRRELGLRLVPADRFDYALLADLRAYENLAITDVPHDRYGPPWMLSRKKMKQHAATIFEEREILGGHPSTLTRLLSGGNAQKLLLARELNADSAVLVAHSPTRGLDVRACQVVHETIVENVKSGAACLLISEDLDEVVALSSRIAVLSRGELSGPFDAGEISRSQIGELMAGHA